MKLREYVMQNRLEHTWLEVNVPGKHSQNPVFSGYPAFWMGQERTFFMNCDVKRIAVGTFTNFPGQPGMTIGGQRLLVE